MKRQKTLHANYADPLTTQKLISTLFFHSFLQFLKNKPLINIAAVFSLLLQLNLLQTEAVQILKIWAKYKIK
jgi:hypothetical protein